MTAESIFTNARGVDLHLLREGNGSPVVILHGFTGSSASMAGVSSGLCDRYTTLRIDLIGHGRSDAPRKTSDYAFERCVDQVAAVISTLATAPVHLIGYSLGGRVALGLCAQHPDSVRSATLIGARAGIAAEEARSQRVRADEELADRIERDGIEKFVDDWMSLPLFASQARLGAEQLAAARRQRLQNRPRGLANSLRGMGAGAQPALAGKLRGFTAPVRLIVGAEDAKFHELAVELARDLPRARVETIPEAGHAAHLENPAAFLEVVRDFLAEVDAECALAVEHA
jgi:2-succinyl-6-hydroxy-2,4-cyclohexadiene-1-carboxylate synthase